MSEVELAGEERHGIDREVHTLPCYLQMILDCFSHQ